jgi:hypothetical protein
MQATTELIENARTLIEENCTCKNSSHSSDTCSTCKAISLLYDAQERLKKE